MVQTKISVKTSHLLELWRRAPLPELYEPKGKRAAAAGKQETLNAKSRACEGELKAHEMDSTIPTFSISSESEYLLSGSVNGIPASILVDTGAATTVLAKEVWDVLVAKTPEAQLESAAGKKLVGVQGTPLQLHGTTQVCLTLCTR